MKSIGIVREVTDCGSVVIPKDIRERRNINPRDPVEIYVEGDKIILEKYEQKCIFCGEVTGIINYQGKMVCPNCAEGVWQTLKNERD